MLLSDLMAERGWEADDVVAILSDNGVISTKGKSIGANGVKMVVGRKMQVPAQWADALGVEYEASPRTPDGEGVAATPGGPESPSSGRRETPPKRPDEARIEVVNADGAKKRIAWAYKFVGSGLAAGSGSPGVAHVWADQSDGLAQMWLDAAKDSPWAAKVVTAASAGGPMGELVAAHVYLAGASAYVLGAGIPGGDAVFAKYSKYRPAQPIAAANGSGPEAKPEPEPATDPAAAGTVVDAPS